MKVLGYPLETYTSLESPEPSSPLASEQGIPATRLQGLKSSVISCPLPGHSGIHLSLRALCHKTCTPLLSFNPLSEQTPYLHSGKLIDSLAHILIYFALLFPPQRCHIQWLEEANALEFEFHCIAFGLVTETFLSLSFCIFQMGTVKPLATL